MTRTTSEDAVRSAMKSFLVRTVNQSRLPPNSRSFPLSTFVTGTTVPLGFTHCGSFDREWKIATIAAYGAFFTRRSPSTT